MSCTAQETENKTCRLRWSEILKDAQREMRAATTTAGRSDAQQRVRQAKLRIAEAEQKIEVLKKWEKKFPMVTAEPVARLLKAKTWINSNGPQAAGELLEMSRALRDYLDIGKGESS